MHHDELRAIIVAVAEFLEVEVPDISFPVARNDWPPDELVTVVWWSDDKRWGFRAFRSPGLELDLLAFKRHCVFEMSLMFRPEARLIMEARYLGARQNVP